VYGSKSGQIPFWVKMNQDTTKKVYWLWESGRSFPRKNSIRAISIAFGVSQEEIFGPETKQKQVG